jgi:hypothetical protein
MNQARPVHSLTVGCELGVDAECFGELVFQDDDPAGCFQAGAGVDELPSPLGQAELVAGEAAMPPSERSGSISFATPRARRKAGVTPRISAARPML